MDKDDLALWLSIVATAVSIFSFFISSLVAAWRMWRERARLSFAVSKVIQKNSDGKQFNQVKIKVSNLGLRPIILTAFKALGKTGSYHMGDTGSYHMGDTDPTAAAYGVAIDVFPKHLNPGDTIKFYPVSIEALQQNQTDPNNPTHHFSPWIYFVLVDNFGKYHYMYAQDVLRQLHMVKTWRPRTKWQELVNLITRKLLFRKIKKQKF